MKGPRAVYFLAVRDILKDKKITTLVVFLLAFSYINITFFASFISGLGNTFQEETINTGTSHIIITLPSDSARTYLDQVSSLRKKIGINPMVAGYTAHTSVPITISYKDKKMAVSATGITPSEEMEVTTIPEKVLDGNFLGDSDMDEIVIGKFIAGQRIEDTFGRQQFGQLITGLGVKVGEVVTVKYASGIEKKYRVKGIVGSEGFNFVSQSAYLTKKEVDSVLGLDDQASAILIRLNSKYNAPSVKNFILEQGVANADVKTWEEASSFVGAINETFSVVVLATTLVGVVIVVATIGIVIFINTARKRRIIGVLKAIGMSEQQIMMIFLLQSLLLGIIGTGLGIISIYGITATLDANPIKLPVGDLRPVLTTDMVVSTAVILLVASIVAGFVPARMASRQKILDIIKVAD